MRRITLAKKLNDFPKTLYVAIENEGTEDEYDVNSAMRFSRKQDAETALGWIVPPRHYTRIAEHIWISESVLKSKSESEE